MKTMKFNGDTSAQKVVFTNDVRLVQSILRNRGYAVSFRDTAAAWGSISRDRWQKDAWSTVATWEFGEAVRLMLAYLVEHDGPVEDNDPRKVVVQTRFSINNDPKPVQKVSVIAKAKVEDTGSEPAPKVAPKINVASTGKRGRPAVLGKFSSKEERDRIVATMKGRDVKAVAAETGLTAAVVYSIMKKA